MEKKARKDKIERTLPIQNESYHGYIASSDYYKSKPLEWKYMQGGENMHYLLSNEYQRMWMEEHKEWYNRRNPSKKEPVNVVKKYVSEFNEKVANCPKINTRLCCMQQSEETEDKSKVTLMKKESKPMKALKKMNTKKPEKKNKATATEDLYSNQDSVEIIRSSRSSVNPSKKTEEIMTSNEPPEENSQESLLSPKNIYNKENYIKVSDELKSVTSTARTSLPSSVINEDEIAHNRGEIEETDSKITEEKVQTVSLASKSDVCSVNDQIEDETGDSTISRRNGLSNRKKAFYIK